jgi:SAM-dependent methyltransferase
MLEDLKKTYTDFHKKNKSKHLYPTEWIIRTMLGNYPGLKFDRSKYPGGKILDLGFGDGRNMSLLNNCGLDIYGVEITQDTLDIVEESLAAINVKATLKVGTNTSIPFEDNFFDYVLASSACYYVDAGSSFSDNLNEITRVLKPGGYFIANYPIYPTNFIFENAIPAEDGHVIIQNDIYGIRNGYKFKAFSSNEEIIAALSGKYDDISLGSCVDDYYGVRNHVFISTAKKK